MSEVLDSANPPDKGAFSDSYDDAGDYAGDGDAGEPGAGRRFVAGIVTPPALAIAGLIMATASLIVMPAIGAVADSLSSMSLLTPIRVARINSAGEIIVAVIAALLALTAGHQRIPDNDDESSDPSLWVRHVSGAAIIVAIVSVLFGTTALIVSAKAHQPNIDQLQGVTSGQASIPSNLLPSSATLISIATGTPSP